MILLEKNKFTETIKKDFFTQFSLEKIQELDGFTCHVFMAESKGQKVVLKVSHSSWESKDLVESEKVLIDDLSSRGVTLSRMLEPIIEIKDEEGGHFYGRLYEFIQGDLLEEIDYSSHNFQKLGELIGKFHHEGKNLKIERPSLNDADCYNFKRFVPEKEKTVRDFFENLMAEINEIPKDEFNWGLTHGDCHPGNILIGNDQVTLLDFNDSGYNYFINDIAIVLYMSFPPDDCEDEEEFFRQLYQDFMLGYRKHMQPSPEVLKKIPLFLKLRTLMFHTLEAMLYPCYNETEKKEAAEGIKKRTGRIESNFEHLSYMMNFPFKEI